MWGVPPETDKSLVDVTHVKVREATTHQAMNRHVRGVAGRTFIGPKMPRRSLVVRLRALQLRLGNQS